MLDSLITALAWALEEDADWFILPAFVATSRGARVKLPHLQEPTLQPGKASGSAVSCSITEWCCRQTALLCHQQLATSS